MNIPIDITNVYICAELGNLQNRTISKVSVVDPKAVTPDNLTIKRQMELENRYYPHAYNMAFDRKDFMDRNGMFKYSRQHQITFTLEDNLDQVISAVYDCPVETVRERLEYNLAQNNLNYYQFSQSVMRQDNNVQIDLGIFYGLTPNLDIYLEHLIDNLESTKTVQTKSMNAIEVGNIECPIAKMNACILLPLLDYANVLKSIAYSKLTTQYYDVSNTLVTSISAHGFVLQSTNMVDTNLTFQDGEHTLTPEITCTRKGTYNKELFNYDYSR